MLVNENSIHSVIRKYTRVLYNFIRRFGFTNEETEDILQDVFIKIWKNKDYFDDGKSSIKTWVFTITRNTVYDALRKKKGSKIIISLDEQNDDGGTEEIEDVMSNIIHILEREQNKKTLLDAIDTLDEEEKTILLLHVEESMTFAEISAIVDIPMNTVKSKYRRVLFKLRNKLEQEI